MAPDPLGPADDHVVRLDAVIPVTGSRGPDQTHVPLDRDAGLTRYAESFADVTGLQPVARSRLRERRGLLSMPELDRLARQLMIYLGLDSASGGANR